MLQQELNTEQLLFQLIGACRPVVGETKGAWAGEIDHCWHRLEALGQRMVRERPRPQGLQDRAPLKAHLGGGVAFKSWRWGSCRDLTICQTMPP
jgi:hypothetical protein